MSIMKTERNRKPITATASSSADSIAYVGIDVAKETLAVDAGTLYQGTIPNTPDAVRKMVGTVVRACAAGTAPQFCAEHTGCYGLALADILRGLGPYGNAPVLNSMNNVVVLEQKLLAVLEKVCRFF